MGASPCGRRGGRGSGHAFAASFAAWPNTTERSGGNSSAAGVCMPASNSSAEVLHRRGDGHGRSVAERAEGPAEDVVADVDELVDVVAGALAVLDALHDLLEPPGALPARGALAARLVGVEVGPAGDGAHHRDGLVEDLQGPGAEHRASGRDRVEVERDVEVLPR